MSETVDSMSDILDAVNGFLQENGCSPRLPGASIGSRIEVVNRDGGFPVTIRLQFMDGAFMGVLAGTTDLLGDMERHLKSVGGLELKMTSHTFDINDPGFLDHVLAFVKNPYTFLEV